MCPQCKDIDVVLSGLRGLLAMLLPMMCSWWQGADSFPIDRGEFLRVVGAQLTEDDWQFAGRSETSRRAITATVKASGYQKMMNNWIYNAPDLPL